VVAWVSRAICCNFNSTVTVSVSIMRVVLCLQYDAATEAAEVHACILYRNHLRRLDWAHAVCGLSVGCKTCTVCVRKDSVVHIQYNTVQCSTVPLLHGLSLSTRQQAKSS
jgi:hypothetical protein